MSKNIIKTDKALSSSFSQSIIWRIWPIRSLWGYDGSSYQWLSLYIWNCTMFYVNGKLSLQKDERAFKLGLNRWNFYTWRLICQFYGNYIFKIRSKSKFQKI